MSTLLYTSAIRAERCVLSLEQAVYHACKAERGTLGKIADIYGVNYNTLALQTNPNRHSHTLAPDTIELVLEHTQSPLIMDAICCAHGSAGWFMLPDCEDNSGDMSDIADLSKKFADLNCTTLLAYQDGIIEADEYAEMQKVGHALLRQIQTVLNNAKANMESHNVR